MSHSYSPLLGKPMNIIKAVINAASDHPTIMLHLERDLGAGCKVDEAEWESITHHVNKYLNRLIINKAEACTVADKQSNGVIVRDARRVLTDVDNESCIKYWLNELRTEYFTALSHVWH